MTSHFEKVTEISLKRAIIYPDAEMHGQMSGFFDYGSVGSEIKRRWENAWREHFLSLNQNFHEIQTTIVMPEQVFKASGHLEHFHDPVAVCSKCGVSERADHLLEEFLGEKFEGLTVQELNALMKKHKIVCTKCKAPFKEIEDKSLMFPLQVGASEDKTIGYLRPETAQGPYASFKREFRANRQKLPLGLAIIGKAFRNEISPRQFVFRTREFTQAELQVFFDPKELPEVPFHEVKDYELIVLPVGAKDAKKVKCSKAVKELGMSEFFVYFMAKMQQFIESMGLPGKFRFAQLSDEEKAFYNKYHWDLEVFCPSFGKFVEVAGFHYRTDHDLGGHAAVSKENLNIPGKDYVPHVLELSFGVDRNVFAVLDNAFREESDRTYFALPQAVAPWDAGVYPLVNRESMPEKALEVFKALRESGIKAFYDASGTIGKRYARADEVGVPFGITIDGDTLKDGTVTVRHRDSKEQERVSAAQLPERLCELAATPQGKL